MDLKEAGWNNVEWIHKVQERDKYRDVVNTVFNNNINNQLDATIKVY
jgi:hypothetical protein